MKTLRIFANGLVQGVGYRFYVKLMAEKHNIKGFSENLINGDVLIVAQGKEDALKEFVEECRKGSSKSRIDNLVTLHSKENIYTDFVIK